ncbi:MAG: hypothetical protein ACP5G2_06945 [Candidatus Bipolaricaulaceae bacterium]
MTKRGLLLCGAVLTWSLIVLGQQAGPLPDLSGSWAFLQVTSDYWQVPLLGERQRLSKSVARVEIEQHGANLTLRIREYCSMTIDSGTSLVRTDVPQAFWQRARPHPLAGRIVYRDGRVELVVPWFVNVNGAELGDPEADPLPKVPDDPRVVDQDGDGHPGMTLKVSVLGLISGEVYVVQRLWRAYRGVLEAPNLVRGTISWEDEQSTLGASSSWLLQSGEGRPDPVPAHSYFLLRRIVGEEPCSELLEIFSETIRR